MNECAGLMLEFPTPASQVGRDILQRLYTEWQAPSEQVNIHATSKTEAVKLLSDANSDMVKLLKELGWQQPGQDPVAAPAESSNVDLSGIGPYDRECGRPGWG
jgi:hypothetical protein